MFIYRYIDIASMQDEDDFMLRQFMRTRDHHIGKTWAMLFQYLSLKHALKPHGSISDNENCDDIAKNKVHM
jgi:hypothetical protein